MISPQVARTKEMPAFDSVGKSAELRSKTLRAVIKAPVLDLHTHLFPSTFRSLNLWGIDELLTYHYLVAETLRTDPDLTPEEFYAQPKSKQADLIWRSLFVESTPLSEATTGVIRVLSALGLPTRSPNLVEAREYFAQRSPEQHIDNVFKIARVEAVTMTNDPLDPVERAYWEAGSEVDPRFLTVLRIDPILNQWENTCPKLQTEGYQVGTALDGKTLGEVRRFLATWIKRMDPRYMAVSLPDTFEYPCESANGKLLTEAVLPVCAEHGLPLAMMIGVRRAVNPRLLGAGDGMGVAELSAIERMAELHTENRFLVTTLSRTNSHDLCVTARKFSNILPFGCWWFMNNPSLVRETTAMRLEMLGPTFVPQHSDARILDQLIYKWDHSRTEIANALADRYEALKSAGWLVTDADIERDATALMSGNAKEWLGLEISTRGGIHEHV